MTAAPAGAIPCPDPRVVVQFGAERRIRCGRRSCGSCGVLWLTDTRIRTLAAVQAHGGAVALVTVTAPGQDELPWGDDPGRVDATYARRWNESAPGRWSSLHRAAARAARRVADERGASWRLLVKSWEYQKRGVLHLHLLVPMTSPGEVAASNAYVTHLAEAASLHGFGYVDRGKLGPTGPRKSARRLEPVDPDRAARYVSSYVASTGAGKGGVAEVARCQGVPGAVVYLAQTLTQKSGVTMRSLRDRRRIACQNPGAADSEDAWRAACLVDALARSAPPLTAEDRGALLAAALAESWTHVLMVPTGEVRGPTRAPAPGQACRDRAERSSTQRRKVVRLDSVLHRCHNGCLRWVSRATMSDTWASFPTALGEERGQICERHRVARVTCCPDPSDAPASIV